MSEEDLHSTPYKMKMYKDKPQIQSQMLVSISLIAKPIYFLGASHYWLFCDERHTAIYIFIMIWNNSKNYVRQISSRLMNHPNLSTLGRYCHSLIISLALDLYLKLVQWRYYFF